MVAVANGDAAPHAARPDQGASLTLERVLGNLADELGNAIALCVGVEEIVADRLIDGSNDGANARIQLKTIDGLIQMLTDFRSLSDHLCRSVAPQPIDPTAFHPHLIMEEMRRHLLSSGDTHQDTGSPPSSDVSFF